MKKKMFKAAVLCLTLMTVLTVLATCKIPPPPPPPLPLPLPPLPDDLGEITGGEFTMGDSDDIAEDPQYNPKYFVGKLEDGTEIKFIIKTRKPKDWLDDGYDEDPDNPQKDIFLNMLLQCRAKEHTRKVDSFILGNHEVTQKEYREVMEKYWAEYSDVTGKKWAEKEIKLTNAEIKKKANPSKFKGDDLPVENVSWLDAVVYCNARSLQEKNQREEALTPAYTIRGSGNDRTVIWNKDADGYRLPTEAEWEFACRAGTKTLYYSGDLGTVGPVGWYDENSKGNTHPVQKKEPNGWGKYDMHGNVFEWCWDPYSENYPEGDKTEPAEAKPGEWRIIRGGCWYTSQEFLRSAIRFAYTPTGNLSIIGFRVARNAAVTQ